MTAASCPDDFPWGAATSAFQVDGRPLADGARPSHRYRFAHTPGRIADGATGDVACDHYQRYRDDAILVITMITDEEDHGSTGVPEGWFANVIASKKVDATSIVMLVLINDPDQPAPVCPPETEDPLKLRTFVEMFPNHIRGSICEISYNAFFEEAVALIDQTCDDFTPAG